METLPNAGPEDLVRLALVFISTRCGLFSKKSGSSLEEKIPYRIKIRPKTVKVIITGYIVLNWVKVKATKPV
jgi:hypothetical protein